MRRCHMADAGLFVGWGEVVRGREAQSLELFNEFLGYLGGLAESGEIESFEPVFLEPHGGDLAGFVLIRGDADSLHAIRMSDEWMKHSTRGGLMTENFGIVSVALGERMERQMAVYMEQIGAFA
jgi:hypothetical protein